MAVLPSLVEAPSEDVSDITAWVFQRLVVGQPWFLMLELYGMMRMAGAGGKVVDVGGPGAGQK